MIKNLLQNNNSPSEIPRQDKIFWRGILALFINILIDETAKL